MAKTITEQIREQAKKSGMTVHKLAIEAKLDRMIVYRFMDGGDILSRNLDAIAEVLRLKIVKQKKI